MAKAWLDWARSVGYKDSHLTASHYEKFCRNSTKDAFRFLQDHLKNEKETRAIKENILIACENPTEPSSEETVDFFDDHTSRTLSEIRLAEERIKKLEKTMAQRSAARKERADALIDYQRRLTLLRSVFRFGENDLRLINEKLRKLESYFAGFLSKRDTNLEKNVKASCGGCEKTAADYAMQNLRQASDTKFGTLDAKNLIAQHTANCIVNAFLKMDGAEATSRKDQATIPCASYIEVLRKTFANETEQNLSSIAEINRLERSLEEAIHGIVGDPCEQLSDLFRIQLTRVGIRRALDHLEHAHQWQLDSCNGLAAIRNKEGAQLHKTHVALGHLASKIHGALATADQTLEELRGIQSECQETLRGFSDSFAALLGAAGDFHRLIAASEECTSLLNSVKAVDVIGPRESVIIDPSTKLEHIRIPAASFDLEFGFNEDIPRLLNDLQRDHTQHQTIVAGLIPKIESSKCLVPQLQSCVDRAHDSLNEWLIIEAEKGKK